MTEGDHHQPDPGEQRPFDLESWREHGFSEESGLDWWRHRIDPAEALRWQRVAVAEPIDAVRWKIAGIGPDTVREWIYAKIDAREAVAWTEMGFSVAEARKHKRAGRTAVQAYGRAHRARLVQSYPPAPQALPGRPGRSGSGPQHFIETVRGRDPRMIHSYMHRQWFDDEAIAWASHGIDAADALAWKELGVTPIEAGPATGAPCKPQRRGGRPASRSRRWPTGSARGSVPRRRWPSAPRV
jgi:hypothetical protein